MRKRFRQRRWPLKQALLKEQLPNKVLRMKSDQGTVRRRIYNELSSLAGFAWADRPSPQILHNALPQVSLNSVDPFFEILGAWNLEQRQITIDPDRCAWAATRFNTHSRTIERITTVHFAAHAVLALGNSRRPTRIKTGGLSEKQYQHEPHWMTCSHHHYDELIRSEELFVQILSYLYLSDPVRSVQDELKAFELLSKGHDDLYSLDYSRKSKYTWIDNGMFRDWKKEISRNRQAASTDLAQLITKVIGPIVPLDKSVLGFELEE